MKEILKKIKGIFGIRRIHSCLLCIIATLGSILDTQLSWESSKFQLARWSHEVAILSHRTTPPHPDHTSFFLSNSVRCPHPSMNIWTQVHVRCPPLILSSMWCYVRCPHPSINIWTHFLVWCPPWFWIVCTVQCAVSQPIVMYGVSAPILIPEYILCPNSSFNLWHDTLKRNVNLAQLVSSSVALPAKLVF